MRQLIHQRHTSDVVVETSDLVVVCICMLASGPRPKVSARQMCERLKGLKKQIATRPLTS